ncbi:MAG: stage II sporulation protein M [Anaerolineaceae bacterium]|nr:stage II sporulation protein M [Anaerolineaceae bacterium]
MLDALRIALVITRREVRDQFRDWRIIFPIIGLTIFFPFLMNFTAQQMVNFARDYGAAIVAERLVPFLLMIVGFFPISVSLVIALESFVGEKERGSIEPLMNTPLEDWQLYLGKLLAATIPPLISSYLGMTVYLVGLFIRGMTIPEFEILIQIIVLSTVQAIMMVAGAVVVSSQATSVRAANLLASFIIIPVALLIQGESIMMFWGTNSTLWWAVLGLVVLTILLVRVGLAHFHREELLGRELDVLNFSWIWKIFWENFTGGARNIKEWYARTTLCTIKRMRLPILIAVGLTLVGFLIGLQQVQVFNISLDRLSFEQVDERLNSLLDVWSGNDIIPVLAIWWQNVRALLLGFILGILSLGILGTIPLIATMGIAGYLFGLLSLNGLPVLTYFLLILPHGIIEIPTTILATAAVLNTGAVLATPNPDKTIGEVMLVALADWLKVTVGFVLPLLLVAAAIEVWLTPRLMLWWLK